MDLRERFSRYQNRRALRAVRAILPLQPGSEPSLIMPATTRRARGAAGLAAPAAPLLRTVSSTRQTALYFCDRSIVAGGLRCPDSMPTPPSIIQLGGVARFRGAWCSAHQSRAAVLGADFFLLSIGRHRSKLGSNAPPNWRELNAANLAPPRCPPFGRGFV
jgi:hypothetical protein